MHRPIKATLAAAGVLLLCGDALSQDVRLPRKGSSSAFDRYDLFPDRDVPRRRAPRPRSGGAAGISSEVQQEPDVIYCRRRARRAKVAQESATQNVVVGYLAGGLIGALITSSNNEEAYQDQKGDFRREAFERCLADRRQRDDEDEEEDD
jgi:hypothetical protein